MSLMQVGQGDSCRSAGLQPSIHADHPGPGAPPAPLGRHPATIEGRTAENEEVVMDLESLLGAWDGETVIVHHDRPTGAWILIALHSTRLGPAGGGTRMKSYPDLEAALQDACRLSAGMTYKLAVPGMPYGGGKAVIALPADFDPLARPALLRRYGALV